jgi:hypothetical protein
VDDEFRVEVELDDDEHGLSLGERLRALDLDEDVRDRLGESVLVTRDGSLLFLYTATEEQAREAERVVRVLIAAEDLTAEVLITRWHPVEEEWKDASLPLPATREEELAEEEARLDAELQEAHVQGRYDWEVVVRMPSRDEAVELERRLASEGIPVKRRFRYVVAGAITEDGAFALEDRLRAELPKEADVRVEVDLSDVAQGPLQFLPF